MITVFSKEDKQYVKEQLERAQFSTSDESINKVLLKVQEQMSDELHEKFDKVIIDWNTQASDFNLSSSY